MPLAEDAYDKLRDMIVAYVKNTGNKVMACAEMTYQVEMAKEVLAVEPTAGKMRPWRSISSR